MIFHAFKCSMKCVYFKIYLRWAFPFDFSSSQSMITEGLRAAYNQMLFLIQEKVIKQKAISPLESQPARVTQPHRRAPTSDDLGEAEFGPFPGGPIIVPDRPPAMTVPALHFPADREAKFMYKMYYRSAEKLDLNPCISSIWTKLYVEEQENLPLLGDVFIVCIKKGISLTDDEFNLSWGSSPVDSSAVLRSLESYFRGEDRI